MAQKPTKYTYREYLEFAHPEFEKFRHIPAITKADLRNLDMDELLGKFREDVDSETGEDDG